MANIRKSLALNSSISLIGFALNLATSMIVARLLTAHEIGVYSVTLACVSIAHMLRDFGIGQYMVQEKDLTPDRIRSAVGLMMIISWTIALAFAVSAHWIALYYREPGMEKVLWVLCLNFIILPFCSPVYSILVRQTEFGKTAVLNLTQNVTQAVTVCLLAWLGFSYFSQAWGGVAGNVVSIAFSAVFWPKGVPFMPSLKEVRHVLHFGTRASGAMIVGETGNSAPDLIMGRTLGFHDVAMFSRAYGVLSMLNQLTFNVIYGVLFPVFAKERREGHDLRPLFLDRDALYAGIICPILAVMAVVAGPLVRLLFGNQWGEAGELARYLCFYGMLGCPFAMTWMLVNAFGRVDLTLRIQIVTQGSKALVILAGSMFDLETLGRIYGLVTLAEISINLYCLRLLANIQLGDIFLHCHKAFMIAAIAATPALALEYSGFGAMLSPFRMVAVAGAGAAMFWLGAAFALNHPWKHEITNIWRFATARLAGR